MKPQKDAVDDYIRRREDPNYKYDSLWWSRYPLKFRRWTIIDEKNGTERIMTEKEREIVYNLSRGRFPDSSFNEYQDLGEYFTSERMDTPLVAVPPTKRSFVPSKWEKLKVMKMYYNIIKGKTKPSIVHSIAQNDVEEEKKEVEHNYDIWENNDMDEFRYKLPRLEAPKMPLPGMF